MVDLWCSLPALSRLPGPYTAVVRFYWLGGLAEGRLGPLPAFRRLYMHAACPKRPVPGLSCR